MSLSSRFLQMAKEEIGEDETKKVQALDQFREWLDKHPFITKSCRGEFKYVSHKTDNEQIHPHF